MTNFFRTLRLLLVFSIFFFSLLFAASTANGTVHIGATYYNSDVSVTESITTNNADYASVIYLKPDVIASTGAGESVDDEFSQFSHSIYARKNGNNGNIKAYLKAESGNYDWEQSLVAISGALAMKVGCNVEGGTFTGAYSNTNSAIREHVSLTNINYSGATTITPESISLTGVGEFPTVDFCAFSSRTEVKNIGKTTTTEANLTDKIPIRGVVDHEWTKGIVLSPEVSTTEESVLIKSKAGWMLYPGEDTNHSINVSMMFNAYNLTTGEPLFDTQYVPPGGEPLCAVVRPMAFIVNITEMYFNLSMSTIWTPSP